MPAPRGVRQHGEAVQLPDAAPGAQELDRTGQWVDIAEHAGVEWAIAIRRRVRELIAARECPLCAGHTA